jgi:hypothetical protein
MVVNRFCFRIIPHASRRAAQSMPLLGSSTMHTSGTPTNATASESLRRWPPLNRLAWSCRLCTNPTSLSCCVIRSGLSSLTTPENEANRSKCSSGVNIGQRISNCGQKPRRSRTEVMSDDTLYPFTIASPSEASSMPLRMLSVVLFPAPFCDHTHTKASVKAS